MAAACCSQSAWSRMATSALGAFEKTKHERSSFRSLISWRVTILDMSLIKNCNVLVLGLRIRGRIVCSGSGRESTSIPQASIC